MNTYRIVSSMGCDFGTYEAESKEEALDKLARDAGYMSNKHAEDVCNAPFDGTVTEVQS